MAYEVPRDTDPRETTVPVDQVGLLGDALATRAEEDLDRYGMELGDPGWFSKFSKKVKKKLKPSPRFKKFLGKAKKWAKKNKVALSIASAAIGLPMVGAAGLLLAKKGKKTLRKTKSSRAAKAAMARQARIMARRQRVLELRAEKKIGKVVRAVEKDKAKGKPPPAHVLIGKKKALAKKRKRRGRLSRLFRRRRPRTRRRRRR